MYPVILSGGSGSRLWPLSRRLHPKPFIKISNGHSLLQNTFLRALDLDPKGILHITGAEFADQVQNEYNQLPQASLQPDYIFEPFGKNTAAAITMAALWVARLYGEEELLLILPSDHVISDQGSFAQAVREASTLAMQGKIVSLGIKPTAPETGYGYIEYEGHTVKRFVEKPSLVDAQRYSFSENYLWNSGIFCCKASVLLKEMSQHAADILDQAQQCFEASKKEADHVLLDSDTFKNVRADSIDYALLEKSNALSVVACDMHWSDVGTWKSLGDHLGNSDENVITEGVKNCYIKSSQRLIAAVGVENLIIVDTPDALLVAHKNNDQEVKAIYNRLREVNHSTHEIHRTVHRSWGDYTVLEEGPHFKVKRLYVLPGKSLSLQSHQHRSEHWVVVSGQARVINADKMLVLNPDESTYIPVTCKHRLSNASHSEGLIVIEVQTGSYLGEDDIVRFEPQSGIAIA